MVFGTYSKYYDLLYKDKNYVGEALYIHDLIQKYRPGATTILNLGCGTGNHDFEFVKLGYEVTGIDMSAEMLAVADKRLSALNSQASSLNFVLGDIRTVRLEKKFDVVVSLFHVMSYQSTNGDLKAAFGTVKANLMPGGLFLFDCWYGPAVLSAPPVVSVKRLEDDVVEVLRIAEPVMHYNENVVDVNYQVIVTEKTSGRVEQIKEMHRMRYLFMPEISGYLSENCIRLFKAEEWMTGKEPENGTWSVIFMGFSDER